MNLPANNIAEAADS